MAQVRKRKYKPNSYELKTRVVCFFFALFCLIYSVIELAIGHTYIPGKRGGLFLSGIPTFFIALSLLALSLPALLLIIDHYDHRDNVATYKSFQKRFAKLSLYLFAFAFIAGFVESILLALDINLFPKFQGFAEHLSFHTENLKNYLYIVDPIIKNQTGIGIAGICLLMISGFSVENFSKEFPKTVFFMSCVTCLLLSTLMLTDTLVDLSSGELAVGRSGRKFLLSTIDAPAKFNAVIVTHFTIGLLMFLASVFGILALITNKIKP